MGDLSRRWKEKRASRSRQRRNGKTRLEDYELIFVEDNSINQHAVAFPGVMNTHWQPNFYSGANGCFIELFAAPGHVNDLFPKAVMFGTRCLFQHNRAPGTQLSNGSSSLGRSL